MAIQVDYTPVGAVYETAKRAGSVQAQLDYAQQQAQRDQFEMQLKAQQDAREWTERMRQEAAAEDYQRTLAMAQAKSQIDFESEVQMYQKKRMMMMSEIEQIQGVDFLTKDDKEVLAKKAYAKHFGVDLANRSMEDFLAKQQYKTALVKQLQERVDGGAMSPEEARNMAAANGIPYSANMFPNKAEELRDKKNKLLIRMSQVQADLARFSEKDPWDFKSPYVAIKDIETGETRKATEKEIGIRDALERQAGEIVAEMEALGQEMSATRIVPPNEIEMVLQKLGPQYREGWRLAQAEGISFPEFLKKIGVKGVGKPAGVKLRKPNLLEKLSPMAAYGYMAGVKEYGKSL